MKNQILMLFLKSVTVAVGISVVYLILTVITGPISFSSQSIQTTKNSLFQSQGTGSVTFTPDTGEIMIGVTKNAGTVTDAQKQVNTAIQAILIALKGLKIDDKDITTTQYNIYPMYNNIPGQTNQATGFTATQTLAIKSPIDTISTVIDVATKNGANMSGQIQFILSDANKEKALQQAREKAVQDAKKKAQDLASAAGIRLGKIVDVQEDTNTPGRIVPLMATGGGDVNAKSETTIPVGDTTITSNVTLSYETK